VVVVDGRVVTEYREGRGRRKVRPEMAMRRGLKPKCGVARWLVKVDG
jgi:hypothetical protein